MPIKSTVNKSEFIDSFERMNRGNNFTYDARIALFDYLEDMSEGLGEDIELDIIAICCEYNEYANMTEFIKDYGDSYETIEDVEDSTTVIRIDDESFIIVAF